jgi:hypothetical protein
MTYVVQTAREDPTIDVVVADAATGAPQRMTILSGVAAVGPEQTAGMRMTVRGQQPQGEPVGFYPPGATGLPAAGDVRAQVEIALSQVVVDARIDNVMVAYGIGDAAVQLVPSPDVSERWPYVTFQCYGSLPLGIRYRLTILRPA